MSWCLCFTLLALLSLRTHRNAATRAALAGLAVSVALMTPFGANLLLGPLEQHARLAARAPCVDPVRAASAPERVGVLLAGGFVRPAVAYTDLAALTHASYARTAHAVQLYLDGRIDRLVISGGARGRVAESEVLAHLAQRLGVPRQKIDIESASLSTWENAQRVKAQWPTGSTQVVVITSALHVPRAGLAFAAAGLAACSAPTDWRHVPFSWSPGYFLPQLSALEKAEDALHEMAGYVVYWSRAR